VRHSPPTKISASSGLGLIAGVIHEDDFALLVRELEPMQRINAHSSSSVTGTPRAFASFSSVASEGTFVWPSIWAT
jgi:hypothetical protein